MKAFAVGPVVAVFVVGAAIAACTPSRSQPTKSDAAGAASSTATVPAALVRPSSVRSERFSPAGFALEGPLYLDDSEFRRETLERSLTNPTNTYSHHRLANYGKRGMGWDALPEWNPRSAPVTKAIAESLVHGGRVAVPDGTEPLWDGKRPTTLEGWVSLGEKVFFGYPLRSEVFLEHALRNPALATRVGVLADAEGTYPGARAFIDDDGKPAIGLTCALCHSRIVRGVTRPGEARREFDYGTLRNDYHQTTKTYVEPGLAKRMTTWGPGRADVTEDDTEDPVAIPDLWGLRDQTFLTQAGTLRHVGPTVLAIRQETQLLHSNHQRVRPPRELSWALAMYLYSLVPPAAPDERIDPKLLERGSALFAERCRSCHSNGAFGGPALEVARIGTDPQLAIGKARGTGAYRPPALLAVRNAAPYLHHGAVASLDDLLDPARLEPSFTRGTLGPGPVAGHVFGTDLPKADRAAIVRFVSTL